MAPITVTVHSDQVVRTDADRFFGIDLNYIRDRDSNRPEARPLDKALEQMGVRWLRFPGGEKSNYHLWSEPPYFKPAPRSLGWYATPKGDRMDFDEFIRHARAAHAEPYVVVGCASEKLTGRTDFQWLQNAVSWVRYSKEHHCGVRYWEIGNENWNKKTTPTDTAQTVVEFSKAMKAEDPSISIGASGDSDRWWSVFLPTAAPYLDFLSVSEYTGWEWKSYDHFLTDPQLGGTAKTAVAAIGKYAPAADRDRLSVIVAETNTKDYSSDEWRDANDVAHALVTFDTLGHLALDPKVRAAMVWTTRWMTDLDALTSQDYALGPKNELMPTGQALRAWGHFMLPLLVRTEGSDRTTEAFAATSQDGRKMNVWLLNRGPEPRPVDLRVSGGYRLQRAERYDGRWRSVSGSDVDELPPLSISVVLFSKETR